MKKNWMIFFTHAGYYHYLFNGTECIAIDKAGERKIWEYNDFQEPVGLPILSEVNDNKRKKTFKVSKQSFQVLARGMFVED